MKKLRKDSDGISIPTFWRRQSQAFDDPHPKRRSVVSNPRDSTLYWQFEFDSLGFFFVVFAPIDREALIMSENDSKLRHSETFPLSRDPSFSDLTQMPPKLRSASRGPKSKRQLQTRSWHESQKLTLSPSSSPKLFAKVSRCASTVEASNGRGSPSSMLKFTRLKMPKSATSDHISMNSSFTNETESMYKSLGNIEEDKVFDGSSSNLSTLGSKSPALQRPPSAKFVLMHLFKLDRFVLISKLFLLFF